MSKAAQHNRIDDITTPALALRPKEAAKALGIGERKLWAMTNAGELPHAHIGRAVVYPVHELKRWLSEQASKGASR
jgi:excisionase family DNA binding protein